METRVIVIAGPTCSGKTKLAINLAAKLKSEIISADSRQVYKYLNIGTAKPTIEQRAEIKHHLVDILYPDEVFNASKFSNEAKEIISNLHRNESVPIIAGGSGLYIKALIDGILDEIKTDENYRSELLDLRKKFGNSILFEKLRKVDPISTTKMLPQNWKRVVRALEVYHVTGKTISHFYKNQIKQSSFDFRQYGIEWERSLLYENINNRVDWMLDNGFIDEVKSLLAMGYNKNLNSLNSVGYKEIIAYLEGEISLDKAVYLIKRNTRRYAKRQITWFRADNRIHWLITKNDGDLEDHAKTILQSIN
ncbi:MAG: tRNA (adenosine(37)-N6)-dimethylallyltransferase MiaA [Ignavibacteriaceae bacterium]|nr:tRNA (adenosine(37)-N6)-dimethylallyltransferase MiaA [Ignavibacteriaceae bacterium]